MRAKRLTLAVLVMAALVAVVAGCSVAKKDQRALERVQAKRSLVDSMFPVVRSLYPCIADTFAVVIPGGIDSVYYPVPVIQVDTVYDRGNAYAEGFIDGQRSVGKMKFARPRPDTLRVTIVDRELEKTVSYLQGQLAEKNNQLQKTGKEKRSKDYWIYGLIGAFVMTNLGWAMYRFK